MSFVETQKTIDSTVFESNLNQFIKSNQAALLQTINGGQALKSFNFVEDNAANLDKPNLPTLEVQSIEEIEGKGEGTMLIIDYQIEYESIVFGTNAATLPALAKKYGNALKRILKNVKAEQFKTGTTNDLTLTKNEIQLDFGAVFKSQNYNGYIQTFNARAVYRLIANAY